MNLDFTNKNAIVCGSTQGIGQAVAKQLAKNGANIILIARNENSLKELASNLEGDKHQFVCADFSNQESLKEELQANIFPNHPIHFLINNTGGPSAGQLTKASLQEFEKAFKMHVLCSQILTQFVVSKMKQENYGRIINIISTSVKAPINGLGVSNTIRGAVASWAKTLANELGEFNITVNNVLPGFTQTKRLEKLIDQKAIKNNTTIEEIQKQMINSIPAKRIGKPEEIAHAVAFLCSKYASYVNGVNLPVDGGRTTCL